jgi:DNA topoisomerase-3
MLARRKPTLVAIDEAHCISHWGHDFRPEYRRLGDRLPILKPAPVIALTATATPLVQDDIALQLGLAGERRFIHGFRRDNIAIEVVEVARPDRPEIVRALLADPERRPAILYSPTRKDAEELAERLSGEFPAAAYHAGMAAAARDRVQGRFLGGELEVVVATIAFGMGVDKADVRTVVHLALPQTLEGYYQEIGRAGRDGDPARAVLLHSFVDRKTIEFLRQRSYPPPDALAQIFRRLTDAGEQREELRARARGLDEETFDRALEKLWIHGGARIEPDETVRRGHDRWQPAYEKQLQHQVEQEEQMARFAEGHGCRMLRLVRHFGDEEDGGERCGQCDSCAPAECAVQSFRAPTDDERRSLAQMIRALSNGAQAAGALYRQSFGEAMDRDSFESLLGGLVRAQVVSAREESFEKDGKRISFQRLQLTPRARSLGTRALDDVTLAAPIAATRGKRKKGRAKKSTAAPSTADARVIEALKAWRLTEARRRRLPAFRVLTDKTLNAIASARPREESALLEVPGIGPSLAKKHGADILRVVASCAPS